MGHGCERINRLSMLLHLLQTESSESLAQIRSAWEAPPTYRDREFGEAIHVETESRVMWREGRPGFFVQLGALITREFQATIRNKHALVARFGLSAFVSLFFSFIFFKVGTASTGCPGAGCAPNIGDHFGALVNIAIGLSVHSHLLKH